MQNIILCDIEESLSQALEMAAKSAQTSVNQYALDRLRQDLGLKKKPRFTAIYHDLDSLFGCWTEDEYRVIEQSLTQQRHIDKALWQ